MQTLWIFLPHGLGVVGALVILILSWRRSAVTVMARLLLYAIVFLIAIGFTPSRWLRIPTPVPTNPTLAEPTTAVILGFGYEMVGDTMAPGAANQFLLDWLLTNHPQVTTLLVQEGVRAAMTPRLLHDKQVYRIHRHDPAIYVDTLDTAFCALQELQQLHQQTILLVAHDRQLQRAVWDFERARPTVCPHCTIITTAVPDTPYPTASLHLQTRNEFIYTVVELLYLRPRDWLRATPTQCKAP